MKVHKISDFQRFEPSKVREKDAAGGESRRENSQRDSRRDKENSGDEPKATYRDVERAVSDFGGESHGLVASTENSGPGLKVVLRDGSGAVVRQFTGEEFVRLREAAQEGAPNRGRLLDRKL